MAKLNSEVLKKPLVINRIIGNIKGTTSGPTIIFIAGIHGNEPAGVIALDQVIRELKLRNISVNGNIYGLAGNLWALEQGKRYQKEDLNRLWSSQIIKQIHKPENTPLNQDRKELIELFNAIQSIVNETTGPFYFIDLHTTSSETIPFITVNDNLLNRKFTEQYPVPSILGIEEFLEGPLLSYINELGYVAFGFEGGQHDDVHSITYHVAFIFLSLVFTGSINRQDINFKNYITSLSNSTKNINGFYEIFDHHPLKPKDNFEMYPGFTNFQNIEKRQPLALLNNIEIKSKRNGRVFMPLYQRQGSDGFFIVRRIPKFFLSLSAVLRTLKMDHVLTLLPGVGWQSKKKEALIVNLKWARFLTKELFHLLGYRSKQKDKTHLVMKNREAASRTNEYKKEAWQQRNKGSILPKKF